jgi:hypothetical protein
MGAPGSGRGRRQRKRKLPFVHEVKRIDAYQLFSKKYSIEGMSCFVTEGYFFERAGVDTYQIERYGTHLGKLRVLKVDCMPQVSRYLFECPNCGSRRRFLSVKQNMIACRGCLKLAYKSQNITLSQRLISKTKQLECKLQAVIVPEFKPKGMHRTTYNKLLDAWYEIDQLSTLAFLGSIKSYQSVKKLAENISISPSKILQETIEENNNRCLTEETIRKKYQS